jgi:hypothetical protein
MEINKLKAIINSPQWPLMEELLQEQIQTTLQGLVAETSEQEIFRKQGRVASLQMLLKLREQLKRK